jgi:2-polyprenyl-6-methoxyphenol hydroxylase-like FAD-dependent oxidoreductase
MTRANPSNENSVLIVGAGPTSLSAILFPHDLLLPVRIVDKTAGPRTTSRAQVVNPRLLELLIGATAIRSVRWYEHWQPLAEIDFGNDRIHLPKVRHPAGNDGSAID